MKKYIILLLATTFLLGTSVSSCTNFLEEKPESEFDEGTFYKTVESLKVDNSVAGGNQPVVAKPELLDTAIGRRICTLFTCMGIF